MSHPMTENVGREFLARWYSKQNLLRKLLAPGNFPGEAQLIRTEQFTCRRATTDFLKFSQTETTTELTLRDRQQYPNDVRLLDYIPADFKNETVRVITNEREVNCSDCRGQGQTYCPPAEECGRCSGGGGSACYPEMICPTCDGTRLVVCRRCRGGGRTTDAMDRWHTCSACGGRGRWSCGTCLSQFGVPIGRVTCDLCMGSSWQECSRCSGRGELVCNICKGRGYLNCLKCDADGRMVYAGMVTNTFSHTRDAQFLAVDGDSNNLKNGVASHHFVSMHGKMLQNEYQNPGRQDVVKQRLQVEDFDVSSYSFQYDGKRFFLNQIKNANGSPLEFATIRLPVSVKRISLASGVAVVAIFIAVASAWLTNYV